jgi:proteasome lid subunit RPN8/RPN11
MSDELVHLHAATLARQLRKRSSQSEAKICIWGHQEDTGGIVHYDVPVFHSRSTQVHGWEVLWDEGFIENVKEYRLEALPNETGGILFGIIDQKDRTITLVKACRAPENSELSPSGFERAAYSSTNILDEYHQRTAGIVTYAGEWHSHPQNYGALPSGKDIGQLKFLTESLQVEGMPALMVIIAESSAGFYLDRQGKIFDLSYLK